MKISDFFAHYGINRNPFAEEDAQSDKVFQSMCIENTYHPAWDKIYGEPTLPSTSVVFGEKGSGKTALRLQMEHRLKKFNEEHPNEKVFVMNYDNFNPFIDRFLERYSGSAKKPEKYIKRWKLWDHIDAILSLGVTQLVDQILQVRGLEGEVQPELKVTGLAQNLKRDLLLLAALYDHSSAEADYGRWMRLCRKLRVSRFWTWKWPVFCFVWMLLVLGAAGGLWHCGFMGASAFTSIYFYLILAAGAGPWIFRNWKVRRQARKLWKKLKTQNIDTNHLRKILLNFVPDQLSNQPLPLYDRSDDRYMLLSKFADLLKEFQYQGVIVLVDRVDEPYQINGRPELMRDLIWPMLDNKLLKHLGIGFKLLLPEELYDFVLREGPEFKERSRLDKQNLIPNLEWTGESLYDLANARLRACTDSEFSGREPAVLNELFDDSMDLNHLISSLQLLHGPRNLFKFLHQLLVVHTDSYTDQNPSWKIAPAVFDAQIRNFQSRP